MQEWELRDLERFLTRLEKGLAIIERNGEEQTRLLARIACLLAQEVPEEPMFLPSTGVSVEAADET